MTRDYIARFLRGWTRPLFAAAGLNGARMPSIAEELATDWSVLSPVVFEWLQARNINLNSVVDIFMYTLNSQGEMTEWHK